MSSIELQVYELFKNRFSENEARLIVSYIEQKAEEKYQQKKDVLATKEDIGTVRKEIAESKVDLIKWMFIFWIGTIGVLSGIMFAMLQAYLK